MKGWQPIPDLSWHRRVWRLALPIMLSNLTLPVVGAVDTAMAGHLPGPEYLGGVGVATTVFCFAFWTFSFLRLATTGLVAQALGRGDGDGIKAVTLAGAGLAVAIAVPLLALQGPCLALALRLIDASAGVSAQATLYFDIRIWAAPAVMANFVAMGVLIGLQRAGWALAVQALIASVNVALDLLFVLVFDWQVPGLAAASVVADYVGLLAGAVALLAVVPQARRAWPLSRALAPASWRPLLALNRDLLLRTLALNLAFAVFTGLSARSGDVVLAANEVLLIFLTFASFALDGFAHACEAIIGQAAGKRDRAALRRAAASATLWAAVTALLASALFALAGGFVIDAMTDVAPVRQEARGYLVYAAAIPLVAVWSFQLDGIFIGATRGRDLRNAMAISVALYLPAALALWLAMGNHGLWLALHLLFVARALTLLRRWPALLADVGGSAADGVAEARPAVAVPGSP